MASSDAPLSIAAITLRTADRSMLASYYQRIIGLNLISQNSEYLSLGVGEVELLFLEEQRNAIRRPNESGLFHTAFVLPQREHLGAWLRHAADQGVQLDGMADHSVSEAVYLQDPEGNGIEMYVDRDRSDWVVNGSRINMDTNPLDLQGLLDLPGEEWQGVPSGSTIGHVHLQVGDTATTDAFYCDEIGFDLTNEMQQASFYGAGGYHHHIAGNTWNSKNAGPRSADATGLVRLDLATTLQSSENKTCTDPWGITVSISNKHSGN